ncbi:MAG: PEGA domain-containing protein [Candidatus Aminicenantes bacterium]|nr:PEGA domain-containing protein [Candidatus Aminicenantes bacterium]
MRNSKPISLITILLFSFTLFAGSYSTLFAQTTSADDEVAGKLKKAEEYYQNGDFKKAIEIYEGVIEELNQKKELVKAKQKLFQIMVSLAFTHFTIQENEKARTQLEKVIKLNPNQELDEEFYPPKFINIFKELRKPLLGSLRITSEPAQAAVYLDGDEVGKTPLKIEKCLKGEHDLKAKLKGYETASQKVTVNAAEESEAHLVLNKSKKAIAAKKEKAKPQKKEKVVVKKADKPKKKKISPVLLVLGAAAVAAVVVLLMGKKEKKPEPREVERLFSNPAPKDIRVVVDGFSLINVFGIPEGAPIVRVEYMARVRHPAMQDLTLDILGTDLSTQADIWDSDESPEEVTEIRGATHVFNGLPPNGRWKLTVHNHGDQRGEIEEWHVKIVYMEQ